MPDAAGIVMAIVRRAPTSAERATKGAAFKGSKAVIPQSKLQLLRAGWQPPQTSPPVRFPGRMAPTSAHGDTPAHLDASRRKGDES